MNCPKPNPISLFIGLLVAAIALLLNLQVAAGASEKEAIKRVLDDQVVAWNRGDLEGYMAGYWQAPQLSFFSNKSDTRGWQPTLERYRARYQGTGQEMGKLTFSELEIELLGNESAYVRGRWQLQMSKENFGGLFTLIFKKLPAGWRIVHDHTSG